jgi:hypothetical protein
MLAAARRRSVQFGRRILHDQRRLLPRIHVRDATGLDRRHVRSYFAATATATATAAAASYRRGQSASATSATTTSSAADGGCGNEWKRRGRLRAFWPDMRVSSRLLQRARLPRSRRGRLRRHGLHLQRRRPIARTLDSIGCARRYGRSDVPSVQRPSLGLPVFDPARTSTFDRRNLWRSP